MLPYTIPLAQQENCKKQNKKDRETIKQENGGNIDGLP